MRVKSLKKRIAFILSVIMIVMNCGYISAGELPEYQETSIETESEAAEEAVSEEPTFTTDDDQKVQELTPTDEVLKEPEEAVTDEELLAEPEEEIISEEPGSTEPEEEIVSEEPVEEVDSEADTEEGPEVSVQENEIVVSAGRSEDVSILKAPGEDDPDEWKSIGGVLWRVQGTKLSISANADAPEDPGSIPLLSVNLENYESEAAWLKDYRDVITEVEFLPSAKDPTCRVWRIGAFAFAGCTKLSVIPIPGSIVEIGYGAFVGCDLLSGFDIKENDFYFQDGSSGILYRKEAYNRYEMLFAPLNRKGQLNISDKTYKIGNYACWGAKCYNGTLKIPASVKYIGDYAFVGCTEFTKIILGSRQYGNYSDLEDRCKAELLTIGAEAFASCYSLREVYIPSSVTEINQSIFLRDTYLKYVYCYAVNSDLSDKDQVFEKFRVCEGFNDVTRTFPNTECQVVYVPWNYCIITFSPTISVTVDVNDKPLLPTCVKYDTTMADTGTVVNTELYVLEKEGYEFGGWVYDDGTGAAFDNFQDVIKSDTKLKAKWKALYEVKFMTGIGSFPHADSTTGSTTSATRTISAGTILEDWPEDPVKPDARFIGWQIGSKDYGSIIVVNKDDEGAVKFTNKYLRNKFKFQGMDYTLNAYYEDYPLMNFWNEKGTDNLYKRLKGSDSNGMTIKFNRPFTQDQVDEINTMSQNYWRDVLHSSDRYEFVGWYSRVGGQGTPLRVNTSNKLYSAMPLKYYIYFKQYLEATYHYGYDKEGTGTEDYTETETKIEARKAYSLKLPPYRKGWLFEGWWNTKDNSGFKYAAGIPANNMTGDKVFYAHWQKLCTITLNRMYEKVYDDEYLDKHPEMREKPVVENVTEGTALYYNHLIPYDKRELSNEGDRLKFDGWYTEPEGQGEKITSISKIEKDMELYAHWVKGWSVNYYVDINKTGGKVLFWGTVVNPLNATVPLVPDDFGNPEPTKYGYLGYLFDGWEDATGNPPNPSQIVTEDMVFNARWYDDPNTPNEPQVTVSFDSLGGPEVPSQTVSENNPIVDPGAIWTDHKLLGWYRDKEFSSEPWDFETDTVSENMYLYANWKYWTAEDEAEYQDNQNGIYWVKIIRGESAPLSQYFKESGLKYTFDKNIVKFKKGKRIIKGKNRGSTLITARRADGSPYETAVRVFVLQQVLLDMYVFNTDTSFDAEDFLTVSGFLPDRWQSSKPKVASIDPATGRVKVNGRGKTVISAFYRDKPVKATLVSEVPKFAKPFVRMKTGQNKRLKIRKMKRYDVVSWNVVSGNNGGSAEIDENGRITALTAGDVTVYASAYGESISCKVHIEPPILREKSIAMYTNKTKKLKLSNTKLKYVEWKSSNDHVAYVDPVTGTLYGLQNGRVLLKTEAGGVVNTCTVVVSDQVKAGTGNNRKK